MFHFTTTKENGEEVFYFMCPKIMTCSGFHIEPENKKVICDECGKDITKEALPYLQEGWDNPKMYENHNN